MTYAQVVKKSITNNSCFQNYPQPDDHAIRTTDTAGFQPFSQTTSPALPWQTLKRYRNYSVPFFQRLPNLNAKPRSNSFRFIQCSVSFWEKLVATNENWRNNKLQSLSREHILYKSS